MANLFRPLAATAAALGVASLGAMAYPDEPKPPPEVKKNVDPIKGLEAADPARPPELMYAVDPKPLSEAAKKGLKYLADQQKADGGWGQGGGWRSGGAGRVEGADVQDPSDVGNTCMAVLALLRAGNTPTVGDYREHVKKGLKFICEKVEKSDDKDLYVTDVRNTQLQGKIGPYVDTFLTALMLSEIKGKGGDDEKRLVLALNKTIAKMAKNQKDDGTFAGNGGWAPVLSQGVANKALSRAKLQGAVVSDEVLARAGRQSQAAAAGRPMAGGTAVATLGGVPASGTVAPSEPPGADAVGRAPVGGRGLGGGGGDAGVPLYSASQAAGNTQDVLNSVKIDAEKAKLVVADPKASPEAKKEAIKKVEEAEKLEKAAESSRRAIGAQVKDRAFVNGFGSNGGEEFLSFLNISEMMVLQGGKEWAEWDGQMQELLPKAQDKDGSWSGHHCITGKTFCTAGALMVMLSDRTQFPAEVIKAARVAKKVEPKKEEIKKDEKK